MQSRPTAAGQAVHELRYAAHNELLAAEFELIQVVGGWFSFGLRDVLILSASSDARLAIVLAAVVAMTSASLASIRISDAAVPTIWALAAEFPAIRTVVACCQATWS